MHLRPRTAKVVYLNLSGYPFRTRQTIDDVLYAIDNVLQDTREHMSLSQAASLPLLPVLRTLCYSLGDDDQIFSRVFGGALSIRWRVAKRERRYQSFRLRGLRTPSWRIAHRALMVLSTDCTSIGGRPPTPPKVG